VNAYRWRAVAVIVPFGVPAVNHSGRTKAQAQGSDDIQDGDVAVDPLEIRNSALCFLNIRS
jgi:hypothetical protein